MNVVAQKLNVARKELLDLGLRNKLINHRTLRRSGLDIVDEKPSEVFRILVSDAAKMTFLHNPSATDAELGDDEISFEQPDFDDIDESGRAARHIDTKLQTAYSPSLLQRRLLNTYYAARTAIEEQGVNTLFLAIGMLKWYEADSSDLTRYAPLILVPISLNRASVESKFNVLYNGDEIGPNLSLREKLKAEFSVDLPLFDEIDESGISEYMDQVRKAIKTQERWAVDVDALSIGFFAFAKFLMFKDLDDEGWDKDHEPYNHPTIKSLLDEGFSGTESFGEDEFLDDKIDPSEVYFVVDADSSQAQALMEIRSGHHHVIQGPPGTGKSQTITNIIADALGRGQKVLFVAEKMAALEVVKRRLSNIGIGEACLELHSNKTNKKQFLDDLKATLGLSRPIAGDANELLEELIRSRDQLNAYCAAVNRPIGKSGVSPIVAFGRLLALEEALNGVDPIPNLSITDFASWSGKNFRELIALCREIQAHLERMGTPSEHPFSGSELKLYQKSLGNKITELSHDLREQIGAYQDSLRTAVSGTGLVDFSKPNQRDVALTCSSLLSKCPISAEVDVSSPSWNQKSALDAALDSGKEQAILYEELSSRFIQGTWEKDVVLHRAALKNYGEKWWRFLISDFRNAKKFVIGHQRVGKKLKSAELLDVYDKILRHQELATGEGERHTLLSPLSQQDYPKSSEEWVRWKQDVDWTHSLVDSIDDEDLRKAVVTYANKTTLQEREKRNEAVLNSAAEVQDGIDTALETCAISKEHSIVLNDLNLVDFDARLEKWERSPGDLQEIVVLNHLIIKLREAKAESLVSILTEWPHAVSFLVHTVEYTWYNALVERAFNDRSELAVFSGARHEEIVRLFKRKDVELFDHNKRILALKHYTNLPRSTTSGGQMAVLRREFEKKRRHLPIRKLMLNCGNAIQAIKPVFMMSPLSVATYLPPGSAEFDLVIFDEASQVKPVDSFGALVRAKQAVVVGDSRQLPPTSFFDSNIEIEDEEFDETDVTAGDMESILSLFAAQGAPERMLQWHYRSRHDSLIAISNVEFYDNRLFIFPSPHVSRDELGLRYHYLPQTVYERGKKKAFNRGEAKAVARAVMKHASEQPDLTLGVAAFSMSQMRVIQDELELLRRENPFHESFFSEHPDEPFFVKNLENVQGDERDVILISIGYGKDESGYISMNFGPLNREGGERRLNVLITRARQRCEIFSNIVAEDIDLHRTQAVGVGALKRYLKYAKDDIIEVPQVTGEDADSEFEIAVANAIVGSGYKVDIQVGSAGFRIDIGVLDPNQPGRYLLGVECDGATYHSARWARDRDRIRQSVLEGLGWTIERVWSTDWFRSPDKELKRILTALESCKSTTAAHVSDSKKKIFEVQREEASSNENVPAEHSIDHYRRAILNLNLLGLELHELDTATFVKCIEGVVEVEGPIHKSELLRIIREGSGKKRAGARIEKAFGHALSAAKSRKIVRVKGDFVWAIDQTDIKPRYRSELNAQQMSIEFIAPEEIKAAIIHCVEHAYGLSPDDVATETCSLFGFKRTTENMKSIVEKQLRALMKNNSLIQRANHLFLANTDDNLASA